MIFCSNFALLFIALVTVVGSDVVVIVFVAVAVVVVVVIVDVALYAIASEIH